MIKIFSNQIKDEFDEICPYCMTPNKWGRMGCCGEVDFESGIVTIDGEVYLDGEYCLIEESEEQNAQ